MTSKIITATNKLAGTVGTNLSPRPGRPSLGDRGNPREIYTPQKLTRKGSNPEKRACQDCGAIRKQPRYHRNPALVAFWQYRLVAKGLSYMVQFIQTFPDCTPEDGIFLVALREGCR